MKLTETKLRQIIREEISEAIDRGFLNSFADALEDLTGREAYVKTSEEDAIRYDGRSNELDIIFRSGGSVGGRRQSDMEIQVMDRAGQVRTGINVPPEPSVAAEEVARELKKINESKSRINEASGYALSRKYQKAADEAFERGEEDPEMALMHIRSMLHAADGIALNIEYSDELGKADLKELHNVLADGRAIAKELTDKVKQQR